MPTIKAKSGSHRYRPASEFDDATLAQKREYWRTKKREQRARLSERGGKPTKDSPGELLQLNAPAVVNSSLSGLCASSSPLQSNYQFNKTANVSAASQRGSTAVDSSVSATESQKEQWLKPNKILPQLPSSCSAKGACGNSATVKCVTARGAVSGVVSSPTPSGTNTSSSVPPVQLTRITNGSSTIATPQPCVSMQGASVPKSQHKAQVAFPETTEVKLVSSPCGPVSIKTEDNAANPTPHIGIKSALVNTPRAKGGTNSQSESEEERAARRREHWRIKKREQRAKMAAKLAKARERTQSQEVTLERKTTQKPGRPGGVVFSHSPSQSVLRGASQRLCPTRGKTSLTSAKRENYKLQTGTANLTTVNQIRPAQTVILTDVNAEKKLGESLRKTQSFSVTRGITRCKTPRQRFLEAQKTLISQRNTRGKSLSLTSVFSTRNIPKIDPSDAPEQVIAKRREYWRIKKREQRAKLSMEMKARLKEKDSLMRRVKRYQKILEEMRRARSLGQSAGNTLTPASETIGGFIKEDGTVTINIPQVSSSPGTATHKSEEELPVTRPQHPTDTKWRSIGPACVNQPPPPLRPPQVKVTFPLAVNKSARLRSLRPLTQLKSAAATVPKPHFLANQTVGQLTLTLPQTARNAAAGGPTAESNLGGCVMKMAVSSSAPSLSALILDPELSEEERMAKKREYWRVKKREQRAARAARLKQGLLQARASSVLQRKRIQRVTTLPLSRTLSKTTGNAEPLSNTSVPVTPHATEIKQERDSMPEVDLNSPPEQAICPDIKPLVPPASPCPSPPGPQLEPDPALSADSQATTLLAVASMKKLLEESLSTVTDTKCEETEVKIELTDKEIEPEMKPNLSELFFGRDEVAPIAADLTLQIKSWQASTDSLEQAASQSPHPKPQIDKTDSDEGILDHTCETSSQTPTNFIFNPCMEVPEAPSSPRRLRTRKTGQQNCCTSEPPKLHHLPITPKHPQQQHCEQQAQEKSQNSASARRSNSGAPEQSGTSSLQKKREYWKLMKRQQRARLRARQRERTSECGSRLSLRNIQMNAVKDVNPATKPALHSKACLSSPTATTSIPTMLVVSPTTCNSQQSHDTLLVKLPVTSEQNNRTFGPSQVVSNFSGVTENHPQALPCSGKWTSISTDIDLAPSLPTLKPPENPLYSINLHPIEPPCPTPDPTLSPIPQSSKHLGPSPTKLTPLNTLVPPKPIPGESEEDFLKRKREYWRIKKKEQRARKAVQDKGIIPKNTSNNWTPILPAQDLQTQDSCQWVNSEHLGEGLNHLTSNSLDTEAGSFPFSDYTAPIQDESEHLFPDYENNNCDEGSISEATWRNRYLMDYDPLNQLLVCMVCGELQYSHSLEGVRAHIEEAHPDTLTLESMERLRILSAWDEQVSQRERFFTSQLQQHGGILTETHRN